MRLTAAVATTRDGLILRFSGTFHQKPGRAGEVAGVQGQGEASVCAPARRRLGQASTTGIREAFDGRLQCEGLSEAPISFGLDRPCVADCNPGRPTNSDGCLACDAGPSRYTLFRPDRSRCMGAFGDRTGSVAQMARGDSPRGSGKIAGVHEPPPTSRLQDPDLAPYNKALKRRGSLTIWFDPAMTWEAAPTGKRGRQPDYTVTPRSRPA